MASIWTIEYRGDASPPRYELKEGEAHRGMFRIRVAAYIEARAHGADAVQFLSHDQRDRADATDPIESLSQHPRPLGVPSTTPPARSYWCEVEIVFADGRRTRYAFTVRTRFLNRVGARALGRVAEWMDAPAADAVAVLTVLSIEVQPEDTPDA